MALVKADRVKETSTTTGTGALTLAGPAVGYVPFSAVCSVGDTFHYAISHQTSGEWETGLGTYSASNTLTRTTVHSSSNNNATVNFAAGTKEVFIAFTKGQLDTLATLASAETLTNKTISGSNNTITNVSLTTGVTGTLPLANGGTGAVTASGVRTNLGLGTAAVLDAGSANGVATLDSGGAVPTSQLPAAILGAVKYQGAWNANTNSPSLASNTGSQGHYYVVSVAGSTNLNGITDWKVGDWAIYNGSVWQKIDNTDAISSVNGQTGAVTLGYADVGAPSTTGVNASGNWNINASNVTGTVAIANGGTGATTATAAINNLLPSQTSNSGKFLTTNGTDTSWASLSVSPGGSNKQVQYNNSGSFAGASKLMIESTGWPSIIDSNQNLGVGDQVFAALQNAGYNMAIGINSLKTISTSSSRNTALGFGTLQTLVGGSDNTAVGYQCFYNTGNATDYNTGIGSSAGSLAKGQKNVAVGYAALYGTANQTCNLNTAIGSQTLFSITTGSSNVAVGAASLYSMTFGTFNTAVGASAGLNCAAGQDSCFIGYQAAYSLTAGQSNTIVGAYSGGNLTNANASKNVILGAQAAYRQADGATAFSYVYNSVYIGAECKGYADGSYNEIVIGYQAISEGQNTTVIGNSNTSYTKLNGYTKTKSVQETVFTITDNASVDINPANGGIQVWVLGASRTPTATNFAEGQSVTLMIDDGSAYAITWSSIAVTWVGGIAPTLATTGYSVITLWKRSNVVYGASVGSVA